VVHIDEPRSFSGRGFVFLRVVREFSEVEGFALMTLCLFTGRPIPRRRDRRNAAGLSGLSLRLLTWVNW